MGLQRAKLVSEYHCGNENLAQPAGPAPAMEILNWGERVIDADIIFYGKEIINTEKLTIPHKHMHKRAFVLVPMLELIPDFVHPVINKTISQIYDDLEEVEDVYLYGTRPNAPI